MRAFSRILGSLTRYSHFCRAILVAELVHHLEWICIKVLLNMKLQACFPRCCSIFPEAITPLARFLRAIFHSGLAYYFSTALNAECRNWKNNEYVFPFLSLGYTKLKSSRNSVECEQMAVNRLPISAKVLFTPVKRKLSVCTFFNMLQILCVLSVSWFCVREKSNNYNN